MRITGKDAIASVLVAAIVIFYIGYVANGSMPLVQDPTGMAAVGLILGAVAAAIGGWIALHEGRVAEITTGALGIVSAVLGILALLGEHVFSATASQWVLGAFMAGVVTLWALSLVRHSGALTAERRPTSRLGHA